MLLRSSLTLLAIALGTTAYGQALTPLYSGSYTLKDLGSAPGLPPLYGGVCFLNANTMLLGGNANVIGGGIFKVQVIRGAGNHIVGFGGAATLYKNADDIDGGICFGPGGVLFATAYPSNMLYQYLPGGGLNPDLMINLTPLGVASSTGACAFVPAGYGLANPGGFRICSFLGGGLYSGALTLNPGPVPPAGTYTLSAVTMQTNTGNGPEGLIYIPPGSPVFNPANRYMLISEWSANQVSAYQLNAAGYPIPATQSIFVTGLTGAEGGFLDPVTNDLIFSTFGGSNQVIVVSGFTPPPPPPPPPSPPGTSPSAGSSPGEGSFVGSDPPASGTILNGSEGAFGFGAHLAASQVQTLSGQGTQNPILRGPFQEIPGAPYAVTPVPPAFRPLPGTQMLVFNVAGMRKQKPAVSAPASLPGTQTALLGWTVLASLGMSLLTTLGPTRTPTISGKAR